MEFQLRHSFRMEFHPLYGPLLGCWCRFDLLVPSQESTGLELRLVASSRFCWFWARMCTLWVSGLHISFLTRPRFASSSYCLRGADPRPVDLSKSWCLAPDCWGLFYLFEVIHSYHQVSNLDSEFAFLLLHLTSYSFQRPSFDQPWRQKRTIFLEIFKLNWWWNCALCPCLALILSWLGFW